LLSWSAGQWNRFGQVAIRDSRLGGPSQIDISNHAILPNARFSHDLPPDSSRFLPVSSSAATAGTAAASANVQVAALGPSTVVPSAKNEYFAGLIEDRSDMPQLPRIQIGTVTWTDAEATGSASDQTAPDSVPVAKVAIAPANFVAEISVCCKASGETALSELSVNVKIDSQSPQDPVRSVDGISMRQTGNVQGDPLIAKVVAQSQDSYQILLSQSPADLDRNTRLLLGRPWIDIPVDFASGRKAILTFATGKVGADIIDEALHPPHAR
jgi:hypothetical protein